MDNVDAPVGASGPVRVRSDIDAPSRWLWLVKWCALAVPHYPILIGLYLLYPLATIAAGAAIAFTGRYPRPLFDFNVGVLRWSWRLMNYRFPMNTTDKYPPFTLASRPDYPADLEVDHPETLGVWGCLAGTLGDGTAQRLRCWASLSHFCNPLCVVNVLWLFVHRDDQRGHVGPLPTGIVLVALSCGVYVSPTARRVFVVRWIWETRQEGHGAL